MKEAPNSPYNKLVFRETFSDEQAVRNNGGVPTAVTYFNGRANILSLDELTQIWSSTRGKIE